MPASPNATSKLQQVGDDLASRSDELLRNSQAAARQAYEKLDESIDTVRDTAPMALSRAAARMEALARQGMERARTTTREVRGQLSQASDRTVGYIREEPVKSVLIAAAAGALIAGLLTALSSRRPYDH